jgi:glycerophosphoryl diester phosphodiesterase
MWTYPKIIAHRGGGSLAPENTLEAFQCGFNLGFRAVEFDVMLTKDLVPVVVHDEELGRTIAGHGLICDTLSADLFKLDAGSWFAASYVNTRVPTYQDVLSFCTRHGIWMNVEIKPAKGFEAITGEIVAHATHDFYHNVNLPLPLFSSFSLEALSVAQSIAPHIPRGVLFDQVPSDWPEQIKKYQAVSLHTNQKYLTAELASQIKQAGIGLSCYTVNEPARARELLGWGVDALFTDNLKMITANFA